ncbi:M1 family metallopeptidase [Candidatus Daviesbacteria bacterium]|nr:M1 family metallopeptidase [Candidatus Daviesbacteria bacterium]
MNKSTKNEVRLPVHVKPERYRIMLRPDLEGFTFYGEETIFLVLEKPTKQITLHAAELEIESAEFIHGNKEVWAGRINYDKKAETATFTFAKNIQKGKGQLKLAFKGILNDKMRGFYRSRYEVSGVSKHLATTQFESTDARRAFPSFDEPAQKAVFDVTLVVPAKTVAISNTIESNIREHESGYKVIEFAPTPKMSTYLLAFIVGEFESVEVQSAKGKVIRVFTTPGKKEQARFALDVAGKCLDFYEQYFGISYPLPVLDLIAIPDFAAGAMENWGAVTYRESLLLIDEEASSTANKQWVALVIAHELAHQWFGNLVTMEWWTHLWLNEGFASFIEFLAIDHIFPEWDIWTQFVGSEMGEAFSLDGLKNTHPIEVEVGHPAEISEIFDKVSYSKGASILRMLMSYLGEKDFQKGLQFYLKKHAYGNAETQDLWKALEEVSGKPVGKLMKNWTSKPGHPVIRLQSTGSRLQLTQSRFFSSPISKRKTKDGAVWSIPITVILGSSARQNDSRIDSGQARMTNLLMNKKSMTISGIKDNEWIKLNAGEASLVRVDYPQEYLKKLEEAVKNGKLPAVDRLGLIRDSFSLAESGQSPTTLSLELTQSYMGEEDYTVWAELTGKLLQLDSLLALEPFYPDFKKYGIKIYQDIGGKLGWKARKGEKHTDSLLRGMVLNMLGGFGDGETIKVAQELFRAYVVRHSGERSDSRIKGGDSGQARMTSSHGIHPDLKGVVYNLVAENGGKKEFDTLMKMYKQEENQQEKDRIGRALGKFKIKALLSKTLDFSISKHVRFQNSLQIIAAVWANPVGRYLAWEFVKKNWKLLKDRYAGGHYFTKVFGPAGSFTKKVDAKDIESFVKKNPVPEAKRTIAQALEQIYSNAEWLKRDRQKIKDFLLR